MWRSLFIAIGVMAIIIGFESLMIDSATFYKSRATTPGEFLDPTKIAGQTTSTWKPSEWFPWAVLSIGSLVVIYSFTLPKRFQTS